MKRSRIRPTDTNYLDTVVWPSFAQPNRPSQVNVTRGLSHQSEIRDELHIFQKTSAQRQIRMERGALDKALARLKIRHGSGGFIISTAAPKAWEN